MNRHLTVAEIASPDVIPASLPTVIHVVVRDLMLVHALVAPWFADVVVDPIGYFMSNWRELQ